MGRPSIIFRPGFGPAILAGLAFVLIVVVGAPARRMTSDHTPVELRSGSRVVSQPSRSVPSALTLFEPNLAVEDASELLVPEPVLLQVLVRPDHGFVSQDPAALRLDRQIARGIADLAGRKLRLVYEDDEARMVERLLTGEVDLVAAHLAVTPEMHEFVQFSLPYAVNEEMRPVAVAVRPDDHALRRVADDYVMSRVAIGTLGEIHTGDLEAIRSRGEIRVLAERGLTSYFVLGGEERGFEYDLTRRFAAELGLKVKFVVPPSRAELVPWLLQGKGDVIASGFTVTPDRADRVAFTRPYQNTQQVIVVRESDHVQDLDDLRGRTVHVQVGSAHLETLRDLRQYEDDFEIEVVPEAFDFEDILEFVEDGTWDVTVCDAHVLDMERAAGRELRAAFPVKAVRYAWAVRPENPELLEQLDAFLGDEYRSVDFNILRKSYFECSRTIAARQEKFRSDVSGRISPYDDLIRRYANEFDLDWRLVAAQMYQESRFVGESVSSAGAAGLMQLMPATAGELGVDSRFDPEKSIRGGTQYLSQMMQRFDPGLPYETRIRFALASYNAGFGHVEDARQLAARLGWPTDRWFGGVEKAILLLERPEYHEKARHGYCRGSETVRYVAEIDRRYRTYLEHVPIVIASTGEPSRPPPESSS